MMPTLFRRQFWDAGTHTSASATSDILPNGTLRITMELDAADLGDTELSVRMAIEANDDGAGNGPWYTLVSTVWTGGSLDHSGNPLPPHLGYRSSVINCELVRGVLDVNKRIRARMDYTVT